MAFNSNNAIVNTDVGGISSTLATFSNLGWTFVSLNFANGKFSYTQNFGSVSTATFTATTNCACNWGQGYISIGGELDAYTSFEIYTASHFDGIIHSLHINDQFLSPSQLLNLYLNVGTCKQIDFYSYFWYDFYLENQESNGFWKDLIQGNEAKPASATIGSLTDPISTSTGGNNIEVTSFVMGDT